MSDIFIHVYLLYYHYLKFYIVAFGSMHSIMPHCLLFYALIHVFGNLEPDLLCCIKWKEEIDAEGRDSTGPSLDRAESTTVTDQLSSVLKELELMKTERSKSNVYDSGRRSNSNSRAQSVSMERSESRDRRSDFGSERDDSRGDRGRERDSEEGSRGRYSTGKRSSFRHSERERGRERERDRDRGRDRDRERSRDKIRVEETVTKGEVQAIQMELFSMRDDMQRNAYLHKTLPAGSSRRDLNSTPNRSQDLDPERLQALVTALRKELDIAERACHTATRRGNDAVEELKYKSDEVTRLQDLLDNCKSDNKRMTRELRSLRDDADYSGRDLSSLSRLEVEKLKAEASSLHSKIEHLLIEQQRNSLGRRDEVESWKVERDRLTAQISSMALSAGSTQDIHSLQVPNPTPSTVIQ